MDELEADETLPPVRTSVFKRLEALLSDGFPEIPLNFSSAPTKRSPHENSHLETITLGSDAFTPSIWPAHPHHPRLTASHPRQQPEDQVCLLENTMSSSYPNIRPALAFSTCHRYGQTPTASSPASLPPLLSSSFARAWPLLSKPGGQISRAWAMPACCSSS